MEVSGAGVSGADKLTLLRFVEEVRRRASRLLDLPLETPACAIALRVAEGEADAPGQVLVRVDPGEHPPIRVVAYGLPTLHPPLLADRLCGALLRADALAAGYRDPPGSAGASLRRAPYPAWFGAGVARLLETARRQEDAEDVLGRWERGKVLPAPVLAEAFSPHASADPALAAQLVAWLLEAPDRRARMVALRDTLARGRAWTAGAFFEAVGCDLSPGGPDAALDQWLLERRWAVLTPGTTSAGLVRRTRRQLRLRPGTPGLPFSALPSGTVLDPADLPARRSAPWMPEAAAAKVFALQRLASGRDAGYRQMAEAYTAFFVALQRRGSLRDLDRLLHAADGLLSALEAGQVPSDASPFFSASGN